MPQKNTSTNHIKLHIKFVLSFILTLVSNSTPCKKKHWSICTCICRSAKDCVSFATIRGGAPTSNNGDSTPEISSASSYILCTSYAKSQ